MENVTESVAEMVARRSYGKLIAFLAARTRDVAAAATDAEIPDRRLALMFTCAHRL